MVHRSLGTGDQDGRRCSNLDYSIRIHCISINFKEFLLEYDYGKARGAIQILEMSSNTMIHIYYKNLRDATHNADFPAALEALISPYIQLFSSTMWPGVRSCARSIKSWKISGGSLNRMWPEISDSALNRS